MVIASNPSFPAAGGQIQRSVVLATQNGNALAVIWQSFGGQKGEFE
jgi:hypothetical protein